VESSAVVKKSYHSQYGQLNCNVSSGKQVRGQKWCRGCRRPAARGPG
jgi:hypothetical protein